MQLGARIGRYRLERALGEGGMKAVWSATDLRDGQEVALAVLHRFAPDVFRDEVRLAQRVVHPHVARVLDGFVTEDGLGVVVSELCRGLDLARHRQGHDLPVGAAVALAHQLACGLAAIHAAHVLHRDVKPANAILTGTGVKVIDFGVSLPAIDAHTAVDGWAAPAGTLPYMAPESLAGDVDARVDTYALGVTLFELITGRLPLPNLGVHAMMAWLARGEPLPLVGLAGVDPRVRALVARLCAAERTQRPYVADIVDALGALAAALGGVVPASTETERPVPPPRDTAVVAPTLHVAGQAPRRIAVTTPAPGRVVVGWPHLPLLALVPDRGGTEIRGFDRDGQPAWSVRVPDELEGGLVADLDGDGVGELYAWSAARLHALDAAGRGRGVFTTPPRAGALPWDDGAPTPLVLDGPGGRQLVIGHAAIDPVTRVVHDLPGGYEGVGAALVAAQGVTGLSAHGAAQQRFRGDVGTAAAILAARRQPGFVVAALERVFDGHPSVVLGLWGPGGGRIGGGVVGRYALETAPLELLEAAQQPATRLFPATVAPLALVGDGAPTDDVIVVPFLVNAPWFGPLLVAFDGTGAERWRQRGHPLTDQVVAPPMLVDLDGRGRPQLVWGTTDGGIHRRDARTGALVDAAVPGRGAPVAALDVGGRGVLQLVTWSPDAIELVPCGPCLPGAIAWLPSRGDLWRSGTLAADGLPVGPRA